MDELHGAADKFEQESEALGLMLDRLLDAEHTAHTSIELVLSQAKRVRRESNLVVRALARLRDSYSPEGTST